MRNLKMLSLLVAVLTLFVWGCAEFQSQPGTVQGGALGAGVGGLAGALLDSNPWRGGVVGAALGGVLGATLGQISDRGAREAAMNNRPVEYRTQNERGNYRYQAEPQGYNPQTKCHKIHEKVYENGRLVRDHLKEVCEGTKQEQRY